LLKLSVIATLLSWTAFTVHAAVIPTVAHFLEYIGEEEGRVERSRGEREPLDK
jgi:hypothetical protein